MKHTPSYGDNISQKEVSSSAKESRRLRVKVTACFKTMLSGLGDLAQWWSAFLWSSWPWVLSSALGGKNKINQICSERKQNSDGLSWITQQYFFFYFLPINCLEKLLWETTDFSGIFSTRTLLGSSWLDPTEAEHAPPEPSGHTD